MSLSDYLRGGLPEEHRVLVMRPAEAPDPPPEELRAIREALELPELVEARCAVEGAETDDERRRELLKFNARFRAAVERIEAEHVTPPSSTGRLSP